MASLRPGSGVGDDRLSVQAIRADRVFEPAPGSPGAVCGNPRDAASWWLIVDIDARVLRSHRKEFDSREAAAAGV